MSRKPTADPNKASIPKPEKWAPTVVALAAILGRLLDWPGLRRETIYRWMKQPGAPKARSNGRHNVAEWLAFVEKMHEDDLSEDAPDKAQEELLKIRAQRKRLEFLLETETGEWTRNEVITAEIQRLLSETVTTLRGMEEKAPTSAEAGFNVRAFIATELDACFARLHKGAEKLSAG